MKNIEYVLMIFFHQFINDELIWSMEILIDSVHVLTSILLYCKQKKLKDDCNAIICKLESNFQVWRYCYNDDTTE